MPTYLVTVRAFGRISARRFEAASRREAEEMALKRIGFSIESRAVKKTVEPTPQ